MPELVQVRPSADSLPGIFAPSAAVSVTCVSVPPTTLTVTGLSGRAPAAPFAGVTAI